MPRTFKEKHSAKLGAFGAPLGGEALAPKFIEATKRRREKIKNCSKTSIANQSFVRVSRPRREDERFFSLSPD